MILVTGGAGFIGANFVLDWLAATGEPVVNLDKLTYAGNLGSLAPLRGDARHVVRARRHRRPRAGRRAARASTGRARSSTSPPRRTSTARSTGPAAFVQTNVVGTFNAARGGARATGRRCRRASATRFRFLHVSTDEVYGSLGADDAAFTETTPYAPNSPYSASKAASDHLVRAYHHTYGLPTLTTNCSNNYGPLPVPGEADPADDPQRARGQAAAGLRRRPERARLAVRRRSLRGDPRGARARARPARPTTSAATPRGRTSTSCSAICAHRSSELRRAATTRALDHVRRGPARATTAATRSTPAKIRRELGWAPAETFESGLRKTVRWYLDNGDVARRA